MFNTYASPFSPGPQEGQGYGPEMQHPYPDQYQNELGI